jgi:DNA-binding LytR/AlgR family response regulator
MRIAVCDDEKDVLDGTCACIRRHPGEKTLKAYRSARALVEDYKAGIRYDLVFMDVQLGDSLDGFQAVDLLRMEFPRERPQVVFLTVLGGRMRDGVRLSCRDYITKPASEADIHETLDRLYAELGNREILIDSCDGFCKVRIDDIFYVEAMQGASVVHAVDTTYAVKPGLLEMSRMLPETVFAWTHRCYLLNLGHVVRYDKDGASLPNGDKVPISRRRMSAFTAALADYVRCTRFV